MNSCCVASVIFEGNLPYFPEFLTSLQNQSDTNFTLLLFNDGVKELQQHLTAYRLPFRIIEVSGTIAAVRFQMLTYLAGTKFKHTIFGDTDDYFASNRVSVSKAFLENHAILAHDVWLVAENGTSITNEFWANRADISETIHYETVKHYNMLGLGNTAIQTKILPVQWGFHPNLIAVDWYVFSRLLQQGNVAKFTAETHVYYRQYAGNTIGLKKLTLQQFKKEVGVKAEHYKAMAEIDDDFSTMAKKYTAFSRTLDSLSTEAITPYIKKQERPFWWENVQL